MVSRSPNSHNVGSNKLYKISVGINIKDDVSSIYS